MEQAWAWAHMLKSKLWLTFNVLRTWARKILKIKHLFKPQEFNYCFVSVVIIEKLRLSSGSGSKNKARACFRAHSTSEL